VGVVVDTGVFVHWERRGPSIDTGLMQLDREAFISVITASELLVGVHRANSPILRFSERDDFVLSKRCCLRFQFSKST
jgi:predicted nucleic acid-binding protein